MNWLTNWILKEGPGIRKDEPKKVGLHLLIDVVWREAWELFKLNLVMLLLTIPVVTAPAAFAAAIWVSNRMIEDEVVYFWRDFWRAFKLLFWRATLLGALFGSAIFVCSYAAYIYSQLALQDLLYVGGATLAAALTLFLTMVCICAFTLVVRSNLSFAPLLKAACLATLARPLPILLGVGFSAALWGAHIIFYPASVFLPVVFNFSLGALVMTFSATKPTDFALGLIASQGSVPDVEDHTSNRMSFQTEEKT